MPKKLGYLYCRRTGFLAKKLFPYLVGGKCRLVSLNYQKNICKNLIENTNKITCSLFLNVSTFLILLIYIFHSDGVMYITFTCEPTKFLPFVQNIFIKNGGRLKLSKITNFEALSDFDVIVNCTGLYSQKLVNDALVKPIRGQITRVSKSVFHLRKGQGRG